MIELTYTQVYLLMGMVASIFMTANLFHLSRLLFNNHKVPAITLASVSFFTVFIWPITLILLFFSRLSPKR